MKGHSLAGGLCVVALLLSISLLSFSLATRNWVVGWPTAPANGTDRCSDSCSISIGLFTGIQVMDYQFGPRSSAFSIVEKLRHDLPPIRHISWLAVVILLAVSLLCAVAALCLSLVNAVVQTWRPLLGFLGIIAWSAASLGCCILSCFVFASEFQLYIKDNLLPLHLVEGGFTLTDRVSLGYSYWVLYAAAASLTSTIVFLLVHQIRSNRPPSTKAKDRSEKIDLSAFLY